MQAAARRGGDRRGCNKEPVTPPRLRGDLRMTRGSPAFRAERKKWGNPAPAEGTEDYLVEALPPMIKNVSLMVE
jgi:hypothetical protein